METKVKVYGKAQNRIALGIINAYFVMNPFLRLEELQEAFPDTINPDCGSKKIFMTEKDIQTHISNGEEWYGTARGYFINEDEWLVLANRERVGFVSMWSKDSLDRLIDAAKRYGIEAVESDEKRGTYRLEYVNEFEPPKIGATVKAQSQNRLALGIINAYLALYPQTNYEGLRTAFPDAINPDCGSKHVFLTEQEIHEHIASGEEWYGTARGYFVKDDEWLTLADSSKIGFVSMWSKESLDRLISQARKYNIVTIIDSEIKKGSYEMTYGVIAYDR